MKPRSWHGVGIVEDDIVDSSSFEARKFERIPLSVPVRYKIKPKALFWKPARTVDFSRSGIRIQVPQLLSLDREVDLEIQLPGETSMTRTTGLVVWVRRTEREGYFECGVAFKDLKQTKPHPLFSFFADRMCRYAAEHGKGLSVCPADSWEELSEAYRLVYKEYMKRGYCKAHPSEMHYTYFSLLPASRTFMLKDKQLLLGTLSLIPDSPCGVPMEGLFSAEIGAIRRPGRKIAEVTQLALDEDSIPKNYFSFSLMNFEKMSRLFRLCKILFDYCHFHAGITDLIICVHPRHESLYRYLAFETLGPVRSYRGACGNPGLPMHMDLHKFMTTPSLEEGKDQVFLKDPIPAEILQKKMAWEAAQLKRFLYDEKRPWYNMPAESQKFFENYLDSLPPA